VSDEDRPKARWDPDDRRVGVGDARGHLPTIEAMRAVADQAGWVAESPETHLLPRLLEYADPAAGSPLAIEVTRTGADGTFEIDARWAGSPEPEAWQVRAAAVALIGVVAETSSLIHESRGPDGDPQFEVMTGLLPGDSRLATHGHTLLLRVRTAAAAPGTVPDPGA
jgi:hypothetical protein